MHHALIPSIIFSTVLLLDILPGSTGDPGPQTGNLADEGPILQTQAQPQSAALQEDIEEDKRDWRDLQPSWGKRAWKDLHSGGWGKRGWKDLHNGWGKRAWKDLHSGGWGKRGWKDLHNGWGKRAWTDLQPTWGKRGWRELESSLRSAGLSCLLHPASGTPPRTGSTWSPSNWGDVNAGGWGKRDWNQFHGSWGKRDSYYPDDGYDGDFDDVENYYEDVDENDDLQQDDKRAWNSLKGNWGKRLADWSNFRGSWGKRDPAWHNLKGLWGKRGSDNWNKLQAMWGKRSVIGNAELKSMTV